MNSDIQVCGSLKAMESRAYYHEIFFQKIYTMFIIMRNVLFSLVCSLCTQLLCNVLCHDYIVRYCIIS